MNVIRQHPWLLAMAVAAATATPVAAHQPAFVAGYYATAPAGYACHNDYYGRWVCHTPSYYRGSFGSAGFGYGWVGHGGYGHHHTHHYLDDHHGWNHNGWNNGHNYHGGDHGGHHDGHWR